MMIKQLNFYSSDYDSSCSETVMNVTERNEMLLSHLSFMSVLLTWGQLWTQYLYLRKWGPDSKKSVIEEIKDTV